MATSKQEEEVRRIVEAVLADVDIEFGEADVKPAVSKLVDQPIADMKTAMEEFKTLVTETVTKAKAAAKEAAETKDQIVHIRGAVDKALSGSVEKARKVRKALKGAGGTSGSSQIRDTLDMIGQPGNGVEAGILFLGTQGTSKTFECRRHGATAGFDHFLEIGCHEGMESLDLLGGVDPGRVGAGDAWRDGPIAEAYRLAGTDDPAKIEETAGEKAVMILIDEINRMPSRERSVFLNSMSPDAAVSGCGISVYKLRTGRAVLGASGTLREEVLFVPCENLTIVATGNIGLEFDTYEDDPAGRERWIEVSVEPDRKLVESILKGEIAAAKFKNPTLEKELCKWLMGIFDRTTKLKQDGMLRGAATIRTLTRIVDCLHENANPGEFHQFATMIGEGWISWNADGSRNKEQGDLLKDAIKTAMGAHAPK